MDTPVSQIVPECFDRSGGVYLTCPHLRVSFGITGEAVEAARFKAQNQSRLHPILEARLSRVDVHNSVHNSLDNMVNMDQMGTTRAGT